MPVIGTGVFPQSFTALKDKGAAAIQGLARAVGVTVNRPIGTPGGNQSIAAGPAVAIVWGGKLLDLPLQGGASMWTPTNPTKLFIPIRGVWDIYGTILMGTGGGVAGDETDYLIKKNGVATTLMEDAFGVAVATQDTHQAKVTCPPLLLDENDFIELFVLTTYTTTVQLSNGAEISFSVFLRGTA